MTDWTAPEHEVRPICAVCDKPVDRFSVFYDKRKRETVYIAQCHGAEQTVKLGDGVMIDLTRIQLGRAFEFEALPESKE